MKMLKFLCLYVALVSVNVEAAHDPQDIVLLSDSGFNSHFFGAQQDGTTQLYESIKPFESPTWGTPAVLSDPLVSVNSFEVKKDTNDNFMVAWIGENTEFSIYSLYVRYFPTSLGVWSPIYMVSGISENLVGSYSISINAVQAEIIWTSYDEFFNVVNHSETFNLPTPQ